MTKPSWSIAVTILVLTAACATNPATGERQLSLISRQQEIEMGRQGAQQVEQTIGFVDDPALQQYVARVGQRLAASTTRPDLPWQFHVVNDPTQNAFALPGGFIYVTRGLATLLNNEAQLASVLGHEIGHVTARHAVNQMSKQELAQLGLGLGGVLFPAVQQLGPAIGTGLNLLFLKYSREDEQQADQLGFDYVHRAGYDVAQFARVFAALERASGEQQSALPAWLSTHPTSADRIQAAEARAARVGQPDATIGRDVYLEHVDGVVYGKNPRNGFFRGAMFYHPDLAFQMRFPDGWQMQNLPEAVLGTSAQQDAALQLTLAGDLQPREALSRFLGQAGVQGGRAASETIGDSPAALASFEAQTQQGVVAGQVAFIRYGDHTYQIVGYAAAARAPAYADAFANTIHSFAPLTDPDILAVQPDRIAVVTLPRAETIAQIAESLHAAIPPEELAIVNQVPAPTTRLDAGTAVKNVVK